jgi:glycosyltransferase involved in cell wall biosynthesis
MSERPIRVLSVCTSDSNGGAARAAYRIHQAVRDLGVDSQMFVKQKGTDDPTVLTVDDFIPHHALYRGYDWIRNKAKNKWQHYQWGKYPVREPYFLSDLRSIDIGGALRKIDYDILHLHWINLRFLPLERLPKDKPIVWTLHDSWPFCSICHLPFDCPGYRAECGKCPALHSQDPKDLSHRIWCEKKRIYDKLDLHIVTPSRWMAGNAQSSSLLGGRDIRVIPNGIDTNLYAPGDRLEACKKLHLDPGKKHILFGAMNVKDDPNKGFRYLQEAIGHLAVRLDFPAELIIFGSNIPVSGDISGVPVINLGLLKDSGLIIDVYRAADVTVVPSLSENLSCTIMESLACGTPVAAFDIGGNGDLIGHQKNGWLAREKDSDDLADGIRWCLHNKEDHNLSVNARKRVLDCFTTESNGRLYSELYKSLVKI